MVKKRSLLLDMYGVILKESKGYFVPYTFEHFEKKEYNRLTRQFRNENLFTKAGNGDLSSDEFLALLGYQNPTETMWDYLTNYLTLDSDFLRFAESSYENYDFVLISNDVREWSKYIFELYGLDKYFKKSIVSGAVHMRKPESRIFLHALEMIKKYPDECIFVDNSVRNLKVAEKIGIHTVLFNRDHEYYAGNIVNNFQELDVFLKHFDGEENEHER
jgi:putative hydrolase of the HAD superfamily